LFEPVPANLNKLNNNLFNYQDRYGVEPLAVYTEGGIKKFGIEKTGRLGGINRNLSESIEVNCVSINRVLEKILQKESYIDVLKIDIEGDELDVVKSIDKKYLSMIGTIYFDIDYTLKLDENIAVFPKFFRNTDMATPM
jgi:FkbM family methyltransferase